MSPATVFAGHVLSPTLCACPVRKVPATGIAGGAVFPLPTGDGASGGPCRAPRHGPCAGVNGAARREGSPLTGRGGNGVAS
ncbi:Hypothetical Protein RradSPS_2959 (plasmid) [Rubrobacter radiotolerans]|uniref:Uncharacterized protein n=1 Tax=Rubrobacter radiotolerans TaxID=42256 RepID=A0A023X720_RUBRA|nr:Hypothetical Protein RradSPS_2959 [Rubrobacter radiotolerans]